MPIMDGGTACKNMTEEINLKLSQLDGDRQCRSRICIPIIIGLTAYTDSDTKAYALDSGMCMV